MAKADMHVHSKYSERPFEWFLQRLGANESYTEPEFIYQQAKARGMTFVTLTDHNRIDGVMKLKAAHPEDVFTGVEATTYFPEDGCKIHLLIYGLNEAEFEEIQNLRSDIYRLRAYLQAQNLAHAVAHATFSENNKLNLPNLERLMLLFDHFEGINGARNSLNNLGWMRALNALTPERMERLQAQYAITPISGTPWRKTFTGGSDDHAGLFMGQTYTEAEAETPEAFLEALKQKKTQACGRHNDFRGFAFALYKIAYDFSQAKLQAGGNAWLDLLHTLWFEAKPLGVRKRFMLGSLKWKRPENAMQRHFRSLIEGLRGLQGMQAAEKLPLVYSRLADISDEFFRLVFKSFERDMEKGDLAQLAVNLSASLPALFLSLPFFSTLKHMHRDRDLLDALAAAYDSARPKSPKKVLWFCENLDEAAAFPARWPASERFSRPEDLEVTYAVALAPGEISQPAPANLMVLPAVYAHAWSEVFTLRIPSLLATLEKIEAFDPDVIYLSTPGPLGWLGLLAARLLRVKAIGRFQTDWALHFKHLVADEGASELVEIFSRWFYGLTDEIHAPSRTYIEILENRGYPASKLRYQPQGIDAQAFTPRSHRADYVSKKYWHSNAKAKLLYVRRPGDEPVFAFVLALQKKMAARNADLDWLVVGEAPRSHGTGLAGRPSNLRFTGRIDPELYRDLYSSADLLLHPGGEDVSGQSVLEAQACGLPVLVSNAGAAQEVIAPGKTGWVAQAGHEGDWVQTLEAILKLAEDSEEWAHIRRVARQQVVARFDMESLAQTGPSPRPAPAVRKVPANLMQI